MRRIGSRKQEGMSSARHNPEKLQTRSNWITIFSVICGLTEETQKGHILRATLEAVCYQVRDILEAMNRDSGVPLLQLQVDGGMTANSLLLQLQADLVGLNVFRPAMAELTALVSCAAAAGTWKRWRD